MKRFLAGLLILMMAVTCVSCKKKADSETAFGGESIEDRPDEEVNTGSDVTEEQDEEETDTPSADNTTKDESGTTDTKDTTKKEDDKTVTEDDKNNQQTSENEEQKGEQSSNGEEKKEEDKKEEDKKEENTGENAKPSAYPGTAVTFSAASTKVSYSGSYNNIKNLMIKPVGGETMFLLNNVDGVEQFNTVISGWMGSASGGEDEEEEESLLFDLENEIGRSYDSSYFADNSLLLLCVSGTAGAVEAVNVDGTQLNIYIKSVGAAGSAVLGDMSTSIVAIEVPNASITSCKTYKINNV